MGLYDFQQKIFDDTAHLNRVGYFLDMGLGKTYLGSAKAVQLAATVNLLVCQKSKIADWIEHFERVERIPAFDLTGKKTLAAFLEADAQKVGVINYDLVFRRPELLHLRDFTLMLDESSLIQNSKAKRTKAILKMKPSGVVLLSGTPTSGKYENLWSQCKLLGWDISERVYNECYVNWTTLDVRGMPIKVVDKKNPYKNVDRLKEKMREYGAVFLKTEEVHTLPEQTFIDIKVKETSQYRHFKKNKIIELDGQEFIGDTVLTERLYLRMLAGGYNPAKLEALGDIMQSTNDRLIIFYNFNIELEAIKKCCEELGREYSQVNGHQRDLTAYETDSSSVTLVQYQAGAKGLNLQKANKIVYFSPTVKCEDWQQSIKRIHRIGQVRPCFYYRLICGIEAEVYKALARGVDFTDYLFLED